ncbi:MAG: sulfatase-like hydrolase/transferase [Gammaproteobacteria bacterium]|nr:sulfatase-like hydrolase/transferase [Gammaproteobacteria bacterium]
MKQNNILTITTLITLTIISITWQMLHFTQQFSENIGNHNPYVVQYIAHLLFSGKLSFMPLVHFIFSQVLIYAILLLAIYQAGKNCAELFKLSSNRTYLLTILVWFIAAIFILSANSTYYPHSIFHLKLSTKHTIILCHLSAGLLILALTFSLINMIIRKKLPLLMILIVISISSIIFCLYYYFPKPSNFISSKKNPNIIIIGLDSIRPDHINNPKYKIKTPAIDRLLSHSANFTQAHSPLARTYVAWNTILTGLYPEHSKAVDNLIAEKQLNLKSIITKPLHNIGYTTIFASDNRQFNPIDPSFGFDKIIGPKTGIYDFIFSLINDFPLSNIIMNTPFARLLFPYNYANRITYATYLPSTFDKLLNYQLAKRPNKPLFLGIHLILTHWPYVWAHDHHKPDNWAIEYDDTIHSIDRQLSQILKILHHNNLLKHAVVILLSDHGVSLGLPNDRSISFKKYLGNKKDLKKITKYPYNNTVKTGDSSKLHFNTSSGEGIDMLSFNTSNHIIFGIKTYGLPYGLIHSNSYPISLIDINPTILDLLNIKSDQKTDGISLKRFLIKKVSNQNKPRMLFFETGIWMPMFSIKQLKNGTTQKFLLKKLTTLYTINPKSEYLLFKKSAIKNLLKKKQFGVLFGNWFLAKYPKGLNITSTVIKNKQPNDCDFISKNVCYHFNKIKKPYYVLVNRKTHYWSMDLNSDFAKNSPAKTMMKSLQNYIKSNQKYN